MRIELKSGRKAMFYVAAILVGFCGIAEMGVNPALNGIFETYGYGFTGNYVVSAPAIWMAISAFICAALMARITKKKLLIIGIIIFGISSIFCAALADAWYFAVMRSLMGVGEGITNTVILAYIAQMYMDEKKHAQFIGIWNLFYTIFGAILSLLGGYFAYPDWTRLFVVFLPTIVVLVAVMIFLPELGLEKAPVPIQSSGTFDTAEKEKFGGLFWAFYISFLVFSLMVGFYMYFTSEYVEVTGLGSYDTTGAIMMVYTLAGAAISIFFGKIFMALKKKTAIITNAVAIVALLIMFVSQGSLATTYIASILLGLAYGAYFPYMFTMVVEVAPLSKVDRAIGMITGGYSIMFFAIAYIVNALRPLLSPEMFVVTPQYLFFALLGLAPLIIEIATMPAYNRLPKQERTWDEQAQS